ncbi:MAG: GC-type dockerin domain-anchored protein [Planctomycetota bacterium]
MHTRTRRLTLAGITLMAGLAAAQPDRLTLLSYDGYDAPGLTGQLVMWGNPRGVVVGEDGSLLFTNTIYGRNQTSLGFFKKAVGAQPVAIAHGNYNVAGYDYDTAITRVGPDDILRVCNAPWYPEQFRSNGAGGAVLYAELETPLPTPPSNMLSYSVLLEGDGSDDPHVIWRFNDEPVHGGEPVAPWHDVGVSADGAHTVLWHSSGDHPPTVQIATANDDLVESVIITSSSSGAPVADGMDPLDGFQGWRVNATYLPVVGTSGLIAFSGLLLDDTGEPTNLRGIFVAREGAGYTLLYDPRDLGAAFPGVPTTMAPVATSHLIVTDDDRVLVFGSFLDQPNLEFFYGVWSIDLDGNSTPLLLSGAQAPGFAPGTIISTEGGAIRMPLEPIRRYAPAKPRDGHTHLVAVVEDGAGETRQTVYSIASDGSINPLFTQGDSVVLPGASDGPYTLRHVLNPWIRRVHYTTDGRFVCTHSVESAAGDVIDVVLYRDDAGNLTTLPFYEGVTMDFNPSAVVDEAAITSVGVMDMNDSGLAALVIARSSGPWIPPEETANALVDIFAPECPADANGDGELSPGDFNAWIIAFNSRSPGCDQNGDGECNPADFNAWILNFNAGC